MTAADWEFVSTGPNADPARASTSEGGIFGGAGRTLRPSFSLGGSVSGGGDIDRAKSEQAGQQQSTATTDENMTKEDEEDTTPAALPGHARAWFSLPADGVLDSFLLLQYLRSVLCADGLMKILHCANEQQQRSAGVQSPPLPPPPPSPEADKRQQPQQPRQLHQLNPPPKIDVSFKGMGHRRRSTGTSPLARAYSHGGLGGASGAASVGGGRGGSSGSEGDQTSAAAKAVVAAAVDEAMILAGTNADPRRHSGGSGRTSRRASIGRPVSMERSGNDLDAPDGSESGSGVGGSVRGGSTSAEDSKPSSSVVEAIAAKDPAEESSGKAAITAADATAGEQGSAADKPDRKGQAALGTEETKEESGRTSLQGAAQRGWKGVDPAGNEPWIEDVEIDQADLNFVYSSWQPGVPRSDPAAKRTAAAARKVRCMVVWEVARVGYLILRIF